MNGNTRPRLLTAVLMASITIACLIGGCGDDSNPYNPRPPTVRDTVIGTVSGVVKDAVDSCALANCTVAWMHTGVSCSTATDSNGYFTTGPTLTSGDYMISFYPATAHAAAVATVRFHTIDWHRAHDPDVGGRITEEVNADMSLWPMTGSVSGYVYTALPVEAPRRGSPSAALGDPRFSTGAPGVTVTLDFDDFNLIVDEYTTTTDAAGYWEFVDVPACENYDVEYDTADMWIGLRTAPFESNGIQYGQTQYSGARGDGIVEMGKRVPNIYAPLLGENQRPLCAGPAVTSYSWAGSRPAVDDSLVIEFSHSMAPATVQFLGFSAPFTETWSRDSSMVTLGLKVDMKADTWYGITITGEDTSGQPLRDSDCSIGFQRWFLTEM